MGTQMGARGQAQGGCYCLLKSFCTIFHARALLL